METLQDTLQKLFGFSTFREGQKKVVEALMEGKSGAAVFPTGAGKSLCYQLPAVCLPGMTLVVSPLMALMKDQVDALQAKGIAVARLDSSLSSLEYNSVLKRARAGELKLLYVAPERFNNERFRQSLSEFRISLMAVDEAHCVSEWGHNFRPDYLKLGRYAKFCKAERILALTATATPKVLEDICRRFDLDFSVRTPFHRSNLHLKANVVSDEREKFLGLLASLRSEREGPSIVYVTMQRTSEQVAQMLRESGFEARAYHAGMESDSRTDTQEWFMQSDSGIVVATIAFGMGIDKPNIRAVYHYDPPKSLENYSQEIGRAGRDGEVSLCRFFYYPPDRIPLQNFVYGDTPNQKAIYSLMKAVFQGEDELVVSHYQMSRDNDLRPLVLSTLLTYLELEEYLQALTPVYASYKFKPKADSATILSRYSGPARTFLASVLKHSRKKRIWFEIDIDETAEALKCERTKVVAALDQCALDQWMEIQATDLRHRYQVLKRPDDLKALATDLYERAELRETAEIARLNQALEIATHQGCLSELLTHHFGESLEHPCGTCSFCLGEPGRELSLEKEPSFGLGPLPLTIADKRTIAQFLCGLASPSLQKLKLTKHERFGALKHISFKRVMEAIK